VYGFCALSGAAHLAVYGYDETLKSACDGHRVLLKDGFAVTTAQRKGPVSPERAREIADEQPDIEVRQLRPLSLKHSGDTDKQRESEIIDRFMNYVMRDLHDSGFNPIGLAGSVIFLAANGEPSRAHTFWVLEEGVSVDGKALTPEQLVLDVGILLSKKEQP
jgi:hypothetical protein